MDFRVKNALKLTCEHLEHQKNFRGLRPLDPQGGGRRGRGGRGRVGIGRKEGESKGKEGKGVR